MKFGTILLRLALFFLTTLGFLAAKSQSDIKVYGQKVNRLDKQNRKQGDWIFFDKNGFVQMTCMFRDDVCISPQVFYEAGDTAFVRFPAKDAMETFILFQGNEKYIGSFIRTSDTTTIAEVESATALNDSLLLKINKYKEIMIAPNYYFAQKKLHDYISANFISSKIIFNKTIKALLFINSSGNITKVEFPGSNNYLSSTEERELHWIYSTMPRWQPLFYKNKTMPVVITLSNSSSLSTMSFDH